MRKEIVGVKDEEGGRRNFD
ncbi:uncharacterized protein G2W53_012850 [Senna tora]|uniref:Uncharacterized protein n=1 Tax=Senna tora TaxID=362788 RepID=A0A834TZR0_9FABA|nr:uncharacterized protein G2W53_012850 [Senna tora]